MNKLKLLSLAAMLAATSSAQAWGPFDNDNRHYNRYDNRYDNRSDNNFDMFDDVFGDFFGDVLGDAEMDFTIRMRGKGRARGDGEGRGYNRWDGRNRWSGYNNYYGGYYNNYYGGYRPHYGYSPYANRYGYGYSPYNYAPQQQAPYGYAPNSFTPFGHDDPEARRDAFIQAMDELMTRHRDLMTDYDADIRPAIAPAFEVPGDIEERRIRLLERMEQFREEADRRREQLLKSIEARIEALADNSSKPA